MTDTLVRCERDGGAPCLPGVCLCRTPPPVAPLVCQGRAVDDAGQPTGALCGRVFRPCGATTSTAARVREQARAAGWSVAGPPMCGRCRKPDPAIAAGLTTNP